MYNRMWLREKKNTEHVFDSDVRVISTNLHYILMWRENEKKNGPLLQITKSKYAAHHTSYYLFI